ncbi:MAG: Hsp20/alpha crystallin family protein [Burkholderiaceae bacterium]
MYSTLFSRDLFSQLDELQREVQSLFDFPPSIRGARRGTFPGLNIGQTPNSVELYVFAPGIDPDQINVQLDRGVLTITGERSSAALDAGNGQQVDQAGKDLPESGGLRQIQHLSERFSGRFQRVVSLPDDIDPESVSANYRDGVLHINVRRRESAEPRRITIQ